MGIQYNALIDTTSIILVIAIFAVEKKHRREKRTFLNKLLNHLMICCVSVLCMDMLGLFLDGMSGKTARLLVWSADTLYWIFQAVYCWLWIIFADYWAFESEKGIRKRAFFYGIPVAIEIILILTSPWTKWIYYIDDLNVYVRGDFYKHNIVVYFLYVILTCIIVFIGYIKCKEQAQKNRKAMILLYMFLPFCSIIMDIYVYGISWVWPMIALSLLMTYLSIQQQYITDEALEAAKIRNQLAESQMSVMLSQIKPHFLFNALEAIDCLCIEDPTKAREVLEHFSRYLRANMESLEQKECIPFSQELIHVKNYLYIEKVRFGENIVIQYEITTEDFMCPPLMLQTIVENAVQHGIRMKKGVGTIIIRTSKEEDGTSVISVLDDGAGFDPSQIIEDSEVHIGLKNTKERLQAMCDGTIEINSKVGEGTRVMIKIPNITCE